MALPKTFVCPSCGASVTVHGDETEVRCEFCGTSVIVPEELRSKAPIPPSPAPSPQVVVVETPPTVIYEQQAPLPAPTLRRGRRSCCGCGCGCLAPLVFLLLLAVVLAGILYVTQPDLFSQLLNQTQGIGAFFSDSPQIISFIASPDVVTRGGTVVVVWITNADTARLDEVAAQGQSTQTLSSLPAAGEHTFTITNQTGTITFRLTAVKNGQQATRRATVTVR
jgi:DNA-directed RNA polymerase subunit RPC12/RpoP